ncbi:shikimate dehydrogenase [Endomicrobium proavitum]|uniref:Shikimate dehydrogenase (NADP(+)) n=1 Tax=Endomicrobium proavitum TaxID=1408281 RepID=A0A0G3WIX7_9BACT|nr:shikimate dehydrogenase [Endomicrobium proavitum]AKL98606.1 Shikimate dehydrogenase [Endomicrobium proavitum]
MLNTQTKLYAVLGFPIKHSFSPQMHNAWFERENLNCAYLSFETSPQNFKKTVSALKTLGFYGFNITIPHKTAIMQLVDFTDKAAKLIGAVNTVALKNGKLYGYNTDYSGFLADLLSNDIKIKNKNILIYGAGGAAKAVAYALSLSGAKNVFITNRTHKTAEKLADIFKIKAIAAANIQNALTDADLIVNASACGMKKNDVLPFNAEKIKPAAIIYDLIYNKNTPFAKLAKEKKLKYFTGDGMLVNQGAQAFKIWTGIYPNAKSALKLLKKWTR